MRRSAAIFKLTWLLGTLLGGAACSSTLQPPTGDPFQDLRHPDPTVRVRVALQAVEEERLDLVPLLIENLSHRDGAVRFYCGIALRKVTGEDLGFQPYADPGERQRAIERWEDWARENLPSPEATPREKSTVAGGRLAGEREVAEFEKEREVEP